MDKRLTTLLKPLRNIYSQRHSICTSLWEKLCCLFNWLLKNLKNQWEGKRDSFLVWPLVIIAIVLVVYAIYLIFGGTYVPSGIKLKIISGELPLNFSADGTGPLNIIGWILSGVIATLGVMFLNRRARAMDNQAKAQFKSADVQVKNNEQAQLNQGIQHLGHDSESVRLGGVHTLYQLATNQSTKDKYCETVHSILSAHLRSRTTSKEYRKDHKDKPSAEIQSLLDLLTNVGNSVFREYELKVDFHEAFLCGADLGEAHLEEAFLAGANLREAILAEAHLEGAFLVDARLEEAILVEAHLEGAMLQGVHLEDAALRSVHLEGADLQEAHLEGTRLADAHLEGADLRYAYLEGTDFFEAHLEGADLRYAHLEAASVYGTHLHGTYLNGTYLHGVRSTRSNRVMASFQDSIVHSVEQDTELSIAIFEGGVTEERIKECENAEWRNLEKKKAVMDILRDNTGEEKRGKDIEDLEARFLSGAITGKLAEAKADEIIQRYERRMRDIEDT